MTTRFAISILFLAVGLAGCGTGAVPAARAKAAPAERQIAFQARPAGASGTLVIIRDAALRGGRCYYDVLINGAAAARLDAGEKSTLFLPPGEVLLGAARESEGNDYCRPGLGERTQREISIRDGETQIYRVFIDFSGKMNLQKVAQ